MKFEMNRIRGNKDIHKGVHKEIHNRSSIYNRTSESEAQVNR